ncbi:Methionine aminopeptidase 1D, mitochondrial [Nowakowskiella sp. JEL0407]|nr:Methionine aminopeptidase 1D, mitochondrial [Nowakowskiella sp. JEL0407]
MFARKNTLLKKFGVFDLIFPREKYSPARNVVPPLIPVPNYANGASPTLPLQISYKSTTDRLKMSESCKLAAKILNFAGSLVKPGISTLEIDSKVHSEILSHNAYPSPLNYYGFPKSICTSVNNVLCHGIPDDRLLLDGDIINIDVTVYLNGYDDTYSLIVPFIHVSFFRFHGDTSATFLVGNVDEQGKHLTAVTKECLDKAISICGPGVPLTEIGDLISGLAKKEGFSVSDTFCGHGIGEYFHEPPLIFHHENDDGGIMEENMTFTIEPLLCQGTARYIKWNDGWTVVTEDGGRAAQFEHTILITSNGAEILTLE